MSERDDRLDGLEAVWPAQEPRPDFSARVMARLDDAGPPARAPRPPRPPRRWVVPALATISVAAVTCVVALMVTGSSGAARAPRPVPAQGSLTAEAHTTVALGARGVVVAHPGAVLAWTVDRGGRAEVHQIAGAAFYRVEAGGSFVVHTPAGDVSVLGTCFTVAVSDGVTTVDVDEGTVELVDATSRIELAPGDRGHLGGAAPARRRPAPGAAPAAIARTPVVGASTPSSVPVPRAGGGDCFCFSDPRHLEADQALLDEWAGLCRVRADLPPLLEGTDQAAVDAAADQLGLVGGERVAFHGAAVELTAIGRARVREIYIAATGDSAGADQLDVDSQIEQILQTAGLGEEARLRARLSHERAGHSAPPADSGAITPFEEFFRLVISAGDDFERLLATRVGDARAHELRRRFGGWPGPDFDWFGCP